MSHARALLRRFERGLRKFPAEKLSRGILVAASGGPDSTALARLFHSWRDRTDTAGARPPLWIGHLHHGIRGRDADGDASFVESLARDLQLPFLVHREDIPRLARARGESIEKTGREVRYEKLARWAREQGLGCIAVGHNSDDQAETLLFRLARGTGLDGLLGIPASRALGAPDDAGAPLIIRPLLGWKRADIIHLLQELGQTYREDLTNSDVSIPRNAIRREILPALEARVHPGARRSLLRLRRLAAELVPVLRQAAEDAWKAARLAGKDRSGATAFSIAALRQLPPPILRAVLERARSLQRPAGCGKGAVARGAGYSRLREISRRLEKFAGGTESISIRGLGILRLEEDAAYIEAPAAPDSGAPEAAHLQEAACLQDEARLPIPGSVVWNGWILTCEILDRRPEDPGAGADGFRECLDVAACGEAFTIRGRRRGDVFHPLGAPGRKKLKEFLRERGIPARQRDGIPLVVAGTEIVWVAGERIGERFKSTERTRKWLRLEARRPSDAGGSDARARNGGSTVRQSPG